MASPTVPFPSPVYNTGASHSAALAVPQPSIPDGG